MINVINYQHSSKKEFRDLLILRSYGHQFAGNPHNARLFQCFFRCKLTSGTYAAHGKKGRTSITILFQKFDHGFGGLLIICNNILNAPTKSCLDSDLIIFVYLDQICDNTLDSRQLQVALKPLRQYSGLVDLPPTEFDVDNTIQDTAEHGGMLTVRYKKPRQNTVKVLLMMDSGGSMDYYAQLCSALFQAVSKVGHFKDLKVYYFHNCPYGRVYTDPSLLPSGSVQTEWLLSNLSSEYKVIFVGDAQMAPYELTGGWYYGRDRDPSLPQCGMDWLERFRDKYPHIIWINPSERPSWGQYWCETYDAIARVFPMFPLTVDGLEAGMKKLLAR